MDRDIYRVSRAILKAKLWHLKRWTEASVGEHGNFEGLTLASDTEKDKFEGLALTHGKAHQHKVS
jgi:hypothetical protein